jgi:hypothetical protein
MRIAIGILAALIAVRACGGEPAIVSNVSVVSDKVEDVSSFDAWKKSVVRDGMSDEQKALAAWQTVVKFRHHDSNPQEFVGVGDSGTVDAIKLFNVYGYCAGTAAQPVFMQLTRQLGYETRAFSINKWGVPEVQYGGAWHMFDPGTISYFKKPDGTVASVAELTAAAKTWYDANPGYLGNDAKVKEFQKDYKKGPELIANCPTYDAHGNFPLNFFGWFTAMIIYDGSNKTPFPYEEAASQGYRVNIQLRKGERLTRNWSNKGLHVSASAGAKVECLSAQPGKGVLYYTPQMGDLANGRVGNGTLDYSIPLGDANIRDAFVSAENLALNSEDNALGALHVKDDSKPGECVLRMPCSYVYLSGELNIDALIGNGGSIAILFSDNNGRAWKEIGKFTASGSQKIDLSEHVLRRYDYRLKCVLSGKGTGLNALKISHDIQHSQRALPALGQGENKIAFSAGAQEGTISLEGAGPKFKGKQVTIDELGGVLEHMRTDLDKTGLIIPQDPGGSMTFPVETPGDMLRLRFGCNYRAGLKAEGWDLQVSLDEGKTFKTIDRAAGPTRQDAKWVTFSEIPAGTRKALVRFSGASRGSCILFRYRIDADFAEPHGGFAPVKITYRWDENGQAKEDVHIAKTAAENYSISCAQKPALKSIVLERAE